MARPEGVGRVAPSLGVGKPLWLQASLSAGPLDEPVERLLADRLGQNGPVLAHAPEQRALLNGSSPC